MFKKMLFILGVAVSCFAANPVAVFETTQGTIEMELYKDKAPKTAANFIGLIGKGYYDGISFHRIIQNFMIQGGDPTGTGMGGQSIYLHPFEDEFVDSLTFDKAGILAMANAGPGTNGSQFFITTVPTPWLTGHHTIFGKVTKGMEAVKLLENIKTIDSRPVQKQIIKKAYMR